MVQSCRLIQQRNTAVAWHQDLQGNRGKLCDYLVFLKDMELDSAMPQLYKLFSLVATIGATSAGVERSFSCLKRLKSYTRNTMGQGRLSSLALLAIERTLVKSLEKTPSWYDRVTDHFLEKERISWNVISESDLWRAASGDQYE
ncbi:Zinc finger MYM-type protein 1 [Labeo rohita]|uniref:Zinc finger MYM-type protein 1 n=1 Tax=Labeo rohita TaxID=84645 RepID=A0ABQ8L7F8_LABRO|nr:Zinc finger MYM-type protein 1 [Labeo rohita]